MSYTSMASYSLQPGSHLSLLGPWAQNSMEPPETYDESLFQVHRTHHPVNSCKIQSQWHKLVRILNGIIEKDSDCQKVIALSEDVATQFEHKIDTNSI